MLVPLRKLPQYHDLIKYRMAVVPRVISFLISKKGEKLRIADFLTDEIKKMPYITILAKIIKMVRLKSKM